VAYTFYTHEKVSLLPQFALRGFPPGTYLSTDREWVVEDALEEAELDGEEHVVIELRVIEEYIIVLTEEITEAILSKVTPPEKDDWEEVREDPETGVEVVVTPGEEWIAEEEEEFQEEFEGEEDFVEEEFEEEPFEEEPFEEEPEEEWTEEEEILWEAAQEAEETGLPPEIPPELWPQSIEEALKLTETAVLDHRFPASEATVLGVPFEIFVEEQTPEEVKKEVWYRFNMDPVPLSEFKDPLWKRFLQRLTPWRRGQ
jgi:hypothetical protein